MSLFYYCYLEIIFPSRGTYRTIDHSEIFLGHVGSGTETNFTKRGFIGCIQGFMIGDEMFDLEAAADTTVPDEKYGKYLLLLFSYVLL